MLGFKVVRCILRFAVHGVMKRTQVVGFSLAGQYPGRRHAPAGSRRHPGRRGTCTRCPAASRHPRRRRRSGRRTATFLFRPNSSGWGMGEARRGQGCMRALNRLPSREVRRKRWPRSAKGRAVRCDSRWDCIGERGQAKAIKDDSSKKMEKSCDARSLQKSLKRGAGFLGFFDIRLQLNHVPVHNRCSMKDRKMKTRSEM